MESNDSPEIPDRGETSDIPGLPSGTMLREKAGDNDNHIMMRHDLIARTVYHV